MCPFFESIRPIQDDENVNEHEQNGNDPFKEIDQKFQIGEGANFAGEKFDVCNSPASTSKSFNKIYEKYESIGLIRHRP